MLGSQFQIIAITMRKFKNLKQPATSRVCLLHPESSAENECVCVCVFSARLPLHFCSPGLKPRGQCCSRWQVSHLSKLKQDNPHNTPTGQPDLDNPSLRLFFQVILDCVKLKIKTNHRTLAVTSQEAFPLGSSFSWYRLLAVLCWCLLCFNLHLSKEGCHKDLVEVILPSVLFLTFFSLKFRFFSQI